MAERLKIMIGTKEVAKRFVGSKLVWEAVQKTTERLLLTVRVKALNGFSVMITINTYDKNTPMPLIPKKIQADNKPPLNFDSFVLVNVKTDAVVMIFSYSEDARKRVEDYLSGATIVKFYGE